MKSSLNRQIYCLINNIAQNHIIGITNDSSVLASILDRVNSQDKHEQRKRVAFFDVFDRKLIGQMPDLGLDRPDRLTGTVIYGIIPALDVAFGVPVQIVHDELWMKK